MIRSGVVVIVYCCGHSFHSTKDVKQSSSSMRKRNVSVRLRQTKKNDEKKRTPRQSFLEYEVHIQGFFQKCDDDDRDITIQEEAIK